MCIYLLGQQPRLHGVVDDSDPLQDAPPQSGVGSEQLLHRVLIPSPHVLEQFPYGPQLLQPPSSETSTYAVLLCCLTSRQICLYVGISVISYELHYSCIYLYSFTNIY